MAEINDLDATDANNTGRFPEGMAPSEVNDGARALEGLLARWARDFGDGFVTTGGSSTAYTAASNRTIGSYYDGLTLFLELHTAAGATPTLNVDSVGAQSMVWPDGTAVSSDLPAGLCIVCYDLTNTNWVVLSVARPPDLVNDTTPQLGGVLDTNGAAINESEGSAVASASAPDIWATDGNTVHITGTTTITDFADAPRVGAWRKLIFDGVLTLTHGSGITLPGGANITTAAGDIAFVYADAVDAFRVVYFKASGGGFTYATTQTTTSGNSVVFTSIPSGVNFIVVMLQSVSINNNTDHILVRLGDAGGIENTGYISAGHYGGAAVTSIYGFIVRTGNAGYAFSGSMILSRINGNNWHAQYAGAVEGANEAGYGGGRKTVSATLDRLSIESSSGNSFDGGAVNIMWM